MANKLIILGIAAGLLASVPVAYEANPEAFHALVAASPAPIEVGKAEVSKDRGPTRSSLSGRKVAVARDERGHYYAEFRLNGRRHEAMVDTGATYVAINASTARRIGLDLGPKDFRYTVNTANGSTKAAAATIRELEVGRIRLENVEAVVLDDRALTRTLIGMSFLSRLKTFGVEDGTLVLEQ